MNKLQKLLIGITLGSATLATAPQALADRYVGNHYYAPSRYDQYDRRHDHKRYQERHPRHERHCRHEPHRLIQRRTVIVNPPYHHQSYPSYAVPRGHVATGEYRSATPTIIGGIIGGLAGHEMGKGRGKDVATVAGVILGGSIGRDLGQRY